MRWPGAKSGGPLTGLAHEPSPPRGALKSLVFKVAKQSSAVSERLSRGHMHTCTHTFTHTHARTCMHTHSRTHIHAFAHMHMHACMYTFMQNTHACAHTHAFMHACTHIHSRTHVCTRTRSAHLEPPGRFHWALCKPPQLGPTATATRPLGSRFPHWTRKERGPKPGWK